MTQTFAKRLSGLREGMGLSRAQLADAVGVTYQACYNWEEEDREPQIATLTKLAEVLDVSVHYLMTGTEEAPGTKRPAPKRKTVKDILQHARSELAAAMDLPASSVHVSFEVGRSPQGPKSGRRHRND